MNKIIALCRCIKVSSKRPMIDFHFKGVYLGFKIKKISVEYDGPEKMGPGEDYLLCIVDIVVMDNVLLGKVLKVKKLADIYH